MLEHFRDPLWRFTPLEVLQCLVLKLCRFVVNMAIHGMTHMAILVFKLLNCMFQLLILLIEPFCHLLPCHCIFMVKGHLIFLNIDCLHLFLILILEVV